MEKLRTKGYWFHCSTEIVMMKQPIAQRIFFCRFFEPESIDASHFGIRHYMGDVLYNTQDLLNVNRDSLTDDLITVFHKHHCDFGFATHIFSNELKGYQGKHNNLHHHIITI